MGSDPRHRADDQEPPDVGLNGLGYAPKPSLTAGRVLARHKPQPHRKIPARFELAMSSTKISTATAVSGQNGSTMPFVCGCIGGATLERIANQWPSAEIDALILWNYRS